jgi:tripartite-type tricarboxylate transporter receptor subunit TctC
VVENIAGAAGNIGTAVVAKAAPDGHTLLVTYEGSQAINPSIYVNQAFHPINDFRPVATLAQAAFYVICDPRLPAKDLKEFLALARTRTDPVNYATSGAGSVNHLVGEMIKTRSGVHLVHVPFRGISEAITNIIGGHVQAGVAAVPSVISQVRSGSVRALAVSSAKRIDVTPDVPTVAEAGLDGFDVNPWWGMLAPAGTDMEIVRKINADVAELLEQQEVKDLLAQQGAQAFVSQPEAFLERLRANVAMWSKVVSDAGIKRQ